MNQETEISFWKKTPSFSYKNKPRLEILPKLLPSLVNYGTSCLKLPLRESKPADLLIFIFF